MLNKKEFAKQNDISEECVNEFRNFWRDNTEVGGRNKIIESIAPFLYERNEEKLGLLLSIIGGVPKHKEPDPRLRGQIHMLMVGEPGTGKSQLLNFA